MPRTPRRIGPPRPPRAIPPPKVGSAVPRNPPVAVHVELRRAGAVVCSRCERAVPKADAAERVVLQKSRFYCQPCMEKLVEGWNYHWGRGEHARRTYGLTLEDYGALYEAQDGLCAICRGDMPFHDLVVDHDHRTGIVRGILCKACNSGLGFFKDDPMALATAVAYLLSRRANE